ncbi:hypothetical protein TNIN_250171 [Trichonephila inaurata madagascariensis]|uniref:Uncharacterized protein n=1 Tax=Trichonephila inaurata madagascariensis TaxID=2747483 RepID=A0A8X6I4P5_9ARAC|nr:hypothetical protein TNIN_250171 [Trichonephila inaurata madagascariensis]
MWIEERDCQFNAHDTCQIGVAHLPPSTQRILQRRNKSLVSQKLNDVPRDISTEIHEETDEGNTSVTYSEFSVTDENEGINQSFTYIKDNEHIEVERMVKVISRLRTAQSWRSLHFTKCN